MLNENMKFVPHFRNFKGSIESEDETYKKFNVYGKYTINEKKHSILITELPVEHGQMIITFPEKLC